MSGIGGIVGKCERSQLDAMSIAQHHRGPDDQGVYVDRDNSIGLIHNQLSTIEISSAGHQPMSNSDGSLVIIFDGAIYNCKELHIKLNDYQYQSQTDCEVILAAYDKWGEACLDRLIGEFALVIWDKRNRILFGARDRLGVKPLFLHEPAEGGLWFASEIKALHVAGVSRKPDEVTWSTYLSTGIIDHSERTFWDGIERLMPGECFVWADNLLTRRRWYDPAIVASYSETNDRDDLSSLLIDSVKLRFPDEVTLGACLSGGMDSSLLLGLIHQVRGEFSSVHTFTFDTGDPTCDEMDRVKRMVDKTRHQAHFCRLTVDEIPNLAAETQKYQDEPYDGFNTLGMVKVLQCARDEGVKVLLSGGGLNEGWARNDYNNSSSIVRQDYLKSDFANLTESLQVVRPFKDSLSNNQYRDITITTLPHTMRVNDRVAMAYSTEMRNPFMDHRLIELGLQTPKPLKVRDGLGKWLPRQITARLMPIGTRPAPKKPIQTPQHEWLRDQLAGWATDCIERGLSGFGKQWGNPDAVRKAWKEYRESDVDNGFPVWRWISLGLME